VSRTYEAFLGNLPQWVSEADIEECLQREGLNYVSVVLLRKVDDYGQRCALISAPGAEAGDAIVSRLNYAPLADPQSGDRKILTCALS